MSKIICLKCRQPMAYTDELTGMLLSDGKSVAVDHYRCSKCRKEILHTAQLPVADADRTMFKQYF